VSAPVVCLGQQPCGFFPRRFLVAKLRTARRLCQDLGGGEIVFFFHDSDHDPRETQTLLRRRDTGELARLNFAFCSKLQRKWSPLSAKLIAPGWRESTARQLPAYVDRPAVAAFQSTTGDTVADFCLDAYRRLGLLDGIRIVRSSDPAVRRAACGVADFFVDIELTGETVRARWTPGGFLLHEGGSAYRRLPLADFRPEQVSPTRDTRLRWMQSVVRCTHYVAGAGEQAYLRPAETPEIVFVPREPIDRSDEAYTEAAPAV
jgi:hypothetical protein